METHLERTPYGFARWVEGTPEALAAAHWGMGTRRVQDDAGNLVVLFESEWGMNYLIEKHPDLTFRDTASTAG